MTNIKITQEKIYLRDVPNGRFFQIKGYPDSWVLLRVGNEIYHVITELSSTPKVNIRVDDTCTNNQKALSWPATGFPN